MLALAYLPYANKAANLIFAALFFKLRICFEILTVFKVSGFILF